MNLNSNPTTSYIIVNVIWKTHISFILNEWIFLDKHVLICLFIFYFTKSYVMGEPSRWDDSNEYQQYRV